MKTKRIEWLDFVRGLMMFIIVVVHASDGKLNNSLSFIIRNTLMIFSMPLFFAISGYLFKLTDTIYKFFQMLYKKSTELIIPYIIFSIVCMILHVVKHYKLIYMFYEPANYLWFLYTLFFIFIIFGIMGLLHLNLFIQGLVSILFMIGQLFLNGGFKFGISPISSIGSFMIFFYMGYLWKIKKDLLIKYYHKKTLIICLSILWIIVVSIHFIIMPVQYDTNLINMYDIISKLLSVPVFFLIFINFSHNSFFKYFNKYGKCSLIIYLMQTPIIAVTSNILVKYIGMSNCYIMFAISLIFGWYLSVYICYLAKNYTIIKIVFYPRLYINKILESYYK